MNELPPLRASDATNLAGVDTGRDHLSHSSIGVQNSCLQKYDFRYQERLELISRPKPLTLGKAFQRALELEDPDAAAAEMRAGARILDQADEDALQIDETVIRSAAALYLERWPGGTEEREFQYRVRLRNPWTGHSSNTFDLLGYADGIDRSAGLSLVENKFVGQITAVNVRRLPLDRQVSLSCYGLWRATGETVDRVHYRFARKPSIKPRKGRKADGSDAESTAEFCERLAADYVERADDFYLYEETLFRSSDDLARIEAELWEWAEQLRAARRRRFWPRNTSQCAEYGGCPFIPLCTGDPDAMGLYEVRPIRNPELESTTPLEVAV